MNSIPTSSLTGAAVLDDLALIRAQGVDAAAFLHGQLTNDVLKVSPTQARLAGYCNAQGRMLASFVVSWRPASGAEGDAATPGDLWLACAADLQAAMLKRLRMFVLRAKAALADPGAHDRAVGIVGTDAGAALGESVTRLLPWQQTVLDGASVVRLPDAEGVPRWLWIGPASGVAALLAALPTLAPGVWRWLEVKSGVAQIQAATSAQFVPQMLNYELVGGVDFRKGCYPGQEVVARSQYLGKLKRRAFLLQAPPDADGVRVGQEIFWSGDPAQPAGVVAEAASADLLAELKVAATESGTLHLGSPGGPVLALGRLPYEVPATDASPRSV